MAKAVKLADIALRAGVSTVTVSKALAGQKGVSEEMRDKIKRLADELGYVQPARERREEAGRNYTIGLLVGENYIDKYDSFYLQMYQKVAAKAMDRGCFTMMEVIERQQEGAYGMPRLVKERKVDGLVILGKMPDSFLTYLKRQDKIPTVYMDFTDESQDVDAVISDSFYGAYQLTNYLFQMGHEKIAYVGTVLATSSITDRYLGYMKSMMEHGKQIQEEWVIDDRDVSSGYIDEIHLLRLPADMPTAFVCNCDLTAGRVINKLKENGYHVPEDVSVVGYDNFIYPGICDVEITTYEVDLGKMAECAVDVLLEKLQIGDAHIPSIHTVEGHMVLKDSVRKI